MHVYLDLTEKDSGMQLMLRLDGTSAIREHEDGGTQLVVDGREYWVQEQIGDIKVHIAKLAMLMDNFQRRQFVGNGVARG